MKNITVSDIDKAIENANSKLAEVYNEEIIENLLKEHSNKDGKISPIELSMSLYSLTLDQLSIMLKETLKNLLID